MTSTNTDTRPLTELTNKPPQPDFDSPPTCDDKFPVESLPPSQSLLSQTPAADSRSSIPPPPSEVIESVAAPGANDPTRETAPSQFTAAVDSAPGCDDGPNDGLPVAIKGNNNSHRFDKPIIDDSDEGEDEEESARAPVSTATAPQQQQSTTTFASHQSDATHDATGDDLISTTVSVEPSMLESQPASEQPSTSPVMNESTATTTCVSTTIESAPSSFTCYEPDTPPVDAQSPMTTTHKRVEEEQHSPSVREAAEAAPHTSTAPGPLKVTDAQRREFNRLVLKAHDLLENGKLAAALDVYVLAQRIVCTEKVSRRIAKIKAQLDADKQNDTDDASPSHDDHSEDESPSSDDGETQADGWTIHRRTHVATLGAEFRIPLEAYSKLYPHQREGVKWLAGFVGNKVGGILGDDMGMGKTVQVATFLRGALAKKQGIKTVS